MTDLDAYMLGNAISNAALHLGNLARTDDRSPAALKMAILYATDAVERMQAALPAEGNPANTVGTAVDTATLDDLYRKATQGRWEVDSIRNERFTSYGLYAPDGSLVMDTLNAEPELVEESADGDGFAPTYDERGAANVTFVSALVNAWPAIRARLPEPAPCDGDFIPAETAFPPANQPAAA